MAPKSRRRARGRGLAEAHGFARNRGRGTGPAHELEIRTGPRRRRRPARPAGMRATTRAPRKSSVSMAVALFATLMASATSSAAPGSLDTTFGTGGKVTTSFSGSADMNALVVQPDGKLVAAGWDASQSAFGLARYNTNGSLDSTFGTGGTVSTPIGVDTYGASALVLQSDGKLVAAGNAWKDTVDADFAAIRYNANGSLDTTFGTGGEVTTPIGTGANGVSALVRQPDGKLVAAGYASVSGTYDLALVRYNTDGSLDSTFGTGGKVTTPVGSAGDYVNALVFKSDGKLVAAGNTEASTRDFVVVRYNATGTLDTTFGTGGKVITAVGTGDDVAFALALQPDGNLVAGGYAANAGTDAFALVRYLGQVCGDAVVASPEQCDAGTANGIASSCCTATCQFATAGTTCTGGLCDSTGHCVLTTTTTTTSTTTPTAAPTTTSTTTATTPTTSPTTPLTTTTTTSPTTPTATTATSTTTSTTTVPAPTTTSPSAPESTTTSTTSSTTTVVPVTTTSASSTTMVSTTTTTSTTTVRRDSPTTTLPCPDGGLDGVACLLRTAAHAPDCANDVVPAAIGRRVDQTSALIDRAAAASSAAKQRKLVRQAATLLKKAAHLADVAGKRGKISGACSETLARLLADAGTRAAGIAVGPLITSDRAGRTRT